MTAVGETGDATLRSRPAVLVVDDDPDLLSAPASLPCGGRALRTVRRPSAEAALDVIAAEHIGCVVADLRHARHERHRSRPDPSQPPGDLDAAVHPDDRLRRTASSVIEALDAGADDFLPKPVRLDELVARVRAHLRTQAAWTEVVIAELRTRADAIQAIGQLALSSVPEEAAEAVVTELARRIGSEFVGVYRFAGEDRLEPLATWTRATVSLMGGPPLTPARSRLPRPTRPRGAVGRADHRA